jgi:tryptophanase
MQAADRFYRFQGVVQDLTGFRHIIPTHQGRAAERILFHSVLKAGEIVPNNNHFDTTRANVEAEGAEARDLVVAEGRVPPLVHPFKGNIDLAALERTLKQTASACRSSWSPSRTTPAADSRCRWRTCAACARCATSTASRSFLDACRFAENAWFIKQREPEFADWTPKRIAQEMFRLADGCTMSAKKDGLANIGGFLALNDDEWAERARTLLILTEGFPTYGGLAGYDLEAVARGLEEVVEEPYLRYRIRSTEYLAEKLVASACPSSSPRAVTRSISMRERCSRTCRRSPTRHRAGQRAVRRGRRAGVEIGTVMFGLSPDGTESPAAMDLVRLAIPAASTRSRTSTTWPRS